MNVVVVGANDILGPGNTINGNAGLGGLTGANAGGTSSSAVSNILPGLPSITSPSAGTLPSLPSLPALSVPTELASLPVIGDMNSLLSSASFLGVVLPLLLALILLLTEIVKCLPPLIGLLEALLKILASTSAVGGLPLVGGLTSSVLPSTDVISQLLGTVKRLQENVIGLVQFALQRVFDLLQLVVLTVLNVVSNPLCMISSIQLLVDLMLNLALPQITQCVSGLQVALLSTVGSVLKPASSAASLNLVRNKWKIVLK